MLIGRSIKLGENFDPLAAELQGQLLRLPIQDGGVHIIYFTQVQWFLRYRYFLRFAILGEKGQMPIIVHADKRAVQYQSTSCAENFSICVHR